MKCICDILTMALIVKVHFYSLTSANSDRYIADNKTVCCPEDIDAKDIDTHKQIRSMDFIEVNSSVKDDMIKERSNITVQYNSTRRPAEDNNHYNNSHNNHNNNNDDFQISDIDHYRKKELPLTIIIAGPAAALGICLFLCIAFFFHNMQLNNQAKRITIAINVVPEPTQNLDKCKESDSTCIQQAIPPSPAPSVRIPRDDMFAFSQKRKSTLSVPALTVPATFQHKRGSSWSAFADQEMLSLSPPRRHSSFII